MKDAIECFSFAAYTLGAYLNNCVNDYDMVEIPKEIIWSWHERGRRRKRMLLTNRV